MLLAEGGSAACIIIPIFVLILIGGLALILREAREEERRKKAAAIALGDLSHEWLSPLADDVKDVLLAYFSGLPKTPYKTADEQPFSYVFERGSAWVGLISDGPITDIKVRLTVTFRPTGRGEVEWSFQYEIPRMVKYPEESIRELRDILNGELNGFRDYFLGFCKPQLDDSR